MKIKEGKIVSFRLSEKNKIYLNKLGYLDARNNKKKSQSLNISEFINQCITRICEDEKTNISPVANAKDLKIAWLNHQIKEQVSINDVAINNIRRLQKERDLFIKEVVENDVIYK